MLNDATNIFGVGVSWRSYFKTYFEWAIKLSRTSLLMDANRKVVAPSYEMLRQQNFERAINFLVIKMKKCNDNYFSYSSAVVAIGTLK